MENRRILIIEDEPSIADSVVFALKTEGFDPIWKTTGGEGLQDLQDHPAIMVVLDVGLPDISGFEVCKQIRTFSQVPIIFLTARNDEVDRIVGLEIGADDYLAKPFSPRELAVRIKVILRRITPTESQSTPSKNNFQIQEDQKQIQLNQTPLDLTRYEYRMLKYMIKNPDRVFSREQLMNQAWEEPEASYDRTVDAHMKTIRSKIRKTAPTLDPIKTHRGFGYSFKRQSL